MRRPRGRRAEGARAGRDRAAPPAHEPALPLRPRAPEDGRGERHPDRHRGRAGSDLLPDLVNRCLAAAEHEGLKPLILLNKSDLPQAREAAAALEPYRRLGYPVTALSAKRDAAALLPYLHGETSALVGQSGMGKSTLINALLPDAAARVAEVSAALDSGRHTTTHARLYHLDPATHIIDSPGLQEFGLHHLDQAALESAFVEFRSRLGQCRFRDCRHMSEPGCAVAAACERGEIGASRLESYRRLVRESDRGKRYD
jgi:ribosome biogenesis GTPase